MQLVFVFIQKMFSVVEIIALAGHSNAFTLFQPRVHGAHFVCRGIFMLQLSDLLVTVKGICK